MNHDLVSTLFREFRKLPICDPHTHVPWDKPCALHLGDLLGYHYYTELANSSRGEPVKLPDDPDERIDYVWPHLPKLRGTVQFDWMMGISEIFFEIPRGDWWSKPKHEIVSRAQKVIRDGSYVQRVFERSNVTKVYLTNQFDEDLSRLKDRRLVPCLRTDDLVFNAATAKMVERLDACTKLKSGKSLKEFDKALTMVFDRFAEWKMGYAAVGLPPGFAVEPVKAKVAEKLLKRLADGKKFDREQKFTWASFMVDRLAQQCARVNAPFCLMAGADRGVYEHGVPAGQDLFSCDGNLRGYDGLLNKYPQVRFPMMVVSDTAGLELVTEGWIRHNVYPFSHWWYANNPEDIRREVRRRLDVLPRNKFIGFHSDGYSLEFVLPKFNTFRLQLALVLSQKIEESRIAGSDVTEPLTVEAAVALAEKIMLKNPDEILGVK
ncbi:MAG: glucuronate isomerase [Planctomycetota bacterium]|nr:glucuronate isomerase [Planctomycetota bacterium]